MDQDNPNIIKMTVKQFKKKEDRKMNLIRNIEILEARAKGQSYVEIGEKYNISKQRCQKICMVLMEEYMRLKNKKYVYWNGRKKHLKTA